MNPEIGGASGDGDSVGHGNRADDLGRGIGGQSCAAPKAQEPDHERQCATRQSHDDQKLENVSGPCPKGRGPQEFDVPAAGDALRKEQNTGGKQDSGDQNRTRPVERDSARQRMSRVEGEDA